MIIRLMYVLPMLLGRTYDITKNSVGVDIFSPDTVSKPRIIQESFYRSSYKTVESNSDVKEVLEINGDLSLAVKAGMFKFRGIGSYLKERMNVQNSVDILTKVSFRTVSKSLDFSARPVPLWFTTPREYLGTHFVRSVLYGGDLIASVRFKAVKSEYLQDIRATIKASLEGGSALDLVGEGKLETLDKKLEKKANMEINYYATVPLEGVPNTIKGLRELVRNFEKHVAKENDGLGVPVEVELEELAILNQTFSYIKNTDLETELGFFEEYLDDLLTTKSRLRSWISSFTDSSISEEQEKQISDFNERLLLVLRKFIDTVASLNLEKGPSQLDEAKEAYKEGKGLGMAGKFRRDLNRLMKKVVPPKRLQDGGSKVYTHFGSKECIGDEDTSTVFSGYLASSPRNATGSGFNYVCMPKVPETSSDIVLDEDTTSKIVGVKYGLLDATPFKTNDDMILRGALCAVCLVKQRPSIFTFMGQSECPAEKGWTLQYNGFMMSSAEVNRSENICVDSKLQWHRDSEMGYYDQSLSFVLAQQNEEHTFIPCAVCSK